MEVSASLLVEVSFLILVLEMYVALTYLTITIQPKHHGCLIP